MAHAFPAIRPTERTYEAPDFARVTPEYVETVTYPRLLGSKPGKAKLTLVYKNIPDTEAANLVACYVSTLSGFFDVSLPDEVVAGIDDPELAELIKTGGHLKWFFNGPPNQSAVITGISDVRVDLIGEIVL